MVKIINSNNIKEELQKTGFDLSYLDKAVLKHEFLNIKIQNLKPHQATIIKQTALSKMCDAGVHRDVLMGNVKYSDLILSGTKKQLIDVANSLLNQPFSLSDAGKAILNLVEKNKRITTKIAGILNITDNSFSDGTTDKNEAIEFAKKLIDDGADIIDIGAEATNVNTSPTGYEIEIERLNGIIPEIKKYKDIPISIDTRNSKTAEFALSEGANIINDVSGLNFDPKMIDIVKKSNAKIIITHSKGTPQTMDMLCDYENLCDEIYNTLLKKIEQLTNEGIEKDRIIIDVGFGFAKNTIQNFELMKKISEFNSLEVKIMLGTSRKRFLKSIIENADNETLDELTMLTSFYFMQNNIDILRVHNVKKTKLALDFYNALKI